MQDCEAWQIPTVDELGADSGDQYTSGASRLTAQQIEEIQKQAYEEAFQQGLQQGIEAGEQVIRQRVESLDSIINLLAQPIAEVTEKVQVELVNLCIALLKQLLRREIKLDQGQIVALVRDALTALPVNAKQIQIRLNPEDVAIVNDAFAGGVEPQNWTIIDDPAISVGGCKLVTESSRIDVSIEARVAQLISQVFGEDRVNETKGKN